MKYEESFFPDEHLPTRSGLQVIHTNDQDHGLSEDEIQDRYEFIRCYLMKDFKVLMMIPKPDYKDDFFIPDMDVTHDTYSAFNTYDFQKTLRSFDKYGYAMRKIMERIQDLAFMHSSISNPVDRADVEKRYENYLDCKFRDPLAVFIVKHNNSRSYEKRSWLKKKIAELVRRITEANRIWAQYAPPENWDR